MKRRRTEQREERRKDRVEVNLLGEEEAGRGSTRKGRGGCSLPFTGSVLLLALVVIEGARTVAG